MANRQVEATVVDLADDEELIPKATNHTGRAVSEDVQMFAELVTFSYEENRRVAVLVKAESSEEVEAAEARIRYAANTQSGLGVKIIGYAKKGVPKGHLKIVFQGQPKRVTKKTSE